MAYDAITAHAITTDKTIDESVMLLVSGDITINGVVVN